MMRILGLGFLLLLHPLSITGQEEPSSISVSLSPTDLHTVAASILAAETWLRSHVLALFPSTNISTIIVGSGIPCSSSQWSSVLPSMKNLHHSLHRWGLEGEIKLSAPLSPDCRPDALRPITRKLFQFAPMPDGYFSFAPDGSPIVIPANPPEATVVPQPPTALPANPPSTVIPPPAPCPAPGEGEGQKGRLWCVAKPAVPDEKLQEAMDYACGVGGADCGEIKSDGKCYYPDNLVAHASYAFNNYWQKTKMAGGSCSFDGTALLINSDPKEIAYLTSIDELTTGKGLDQIGTLQRAGDTRWSSHFKSISSLRQRFSPTCQVLINIIEEGKSPQAGDADSAYESMTS